MARRVVILACGNDGRRDDGLGVLAAERIEAMAFPGAEVIVAHQFQPEHATYLQGADLAVFIDAADLIETPCVLQELVPAEGRSTFSHAMSARQVLAVQRRLDPLHVPPAFMLAIRGTDFGLGFGLSARAERDLDQALALVRRMLERPDALYWRQLGDREFLAAGKIES